MAPLTSWFAQRRRRTNVLLVLGAVFASLWLIGTVSPESAADPEVAAAIEAKTAAPTKSPTPAPTPSLMSEREVCQEAERQIEAVLKAPRTRKWVGNCYTGERYRIAQTTDAEGRPEWTVTGQVDSENGFGALIRSTWSVVITDYTDGKYRHRLLYFE